MRTTAILTVLTMVIGVVPPRAASAADEVTAPPTVKSCRVVSDTDTQEGGENSFVIGGTLPGVWTTIGGANWIWGDADNNAPAGPQVFSKTFIVNGTPGSAMLSFATDNGYIVKVNGTEVDNKAGVEINFSTATNLDITSYLIANAVNTLEISVINFDGPGNNPAGLVYRLDMTGSSCDPLPVDVCSNIEEIQTTVPDGYIADGSSCVPKVTSEGGDSMTACNIDTNPNLVKNGSFEDILPAVVPMGGWALVASVPEWVSNVAEGFEVWKNMFGGGSEGPIGGRQNLELDVKGSSKITQSVPTVAGNVYQVRMDFSPRPGTDTTQNKVEISADGTSIGSVQGNGSADTQNSWTAHFYNFTASAAVTVIGLEDKGTSDGLGSLVDNVQVCLVKDNTPSTSVISGYKFNDKNSNGIWDTATEPGIDNWEIVLSQEGAADKYFRTNPDGSYSFIVENGSYQVSETGQKGWEQTATIGENADGDICYINVENENFTCDFGNHQIEEDGEEGGSSTGTRVGGRRGSSRPGEVLGASTSTPTGVVLGDATSTLPVGAPNTGAGGTSPVTTSLPTIVAILPGSVRKSK